MCLSLQPLAPNKAWLKFGLLLHHAVNPFVMAILFYVVILPTGLTLRALGKDLLRLNWDKRTKTYWLRSAPCPTTCRHMIE